MPARQNRQIVEEATDWFVRMRDGEEGPGIQNALMEWLRRSPEHVAAYLDIAALWMETRNVQVDAQVDPATRVAEARADVSVSELTLRVPARLPGSVRSRGGWALAAGVLVVLAGAVMTGWHFGAASYTTGLGEQRSIALRDGSTIEMNSQSRVRIRYGDKQRATELLRGQALFRVAKDARPFIVHAEDTAVRALGTVFDVYRRDSGTVVTVVEGSVSVAAGRRPGSQQSSGRSPEPGQPVLLDAGEQVVVNSERTAQPQPVNAAAATAWTRRELVFEFTPLAEVATEFNRYNPRQLVVEGEGLRAFKVSAVFRSTDAGSLLRYLNSLPGVRLEESEERVVIKPAER